MFVSWTNLSQELSIQFLWCSSLDTSSFWTRWNSQECGEKYSLYSGDGNILVMGWFVFGQAILDLDCYIKILDLRPCWLMFQIISVLVPLKNS